MDKIKKLIKFKPFEEIIKKVILEQVQFFSEKEKKYLLIIAILFLKEFDNNKEKKIYLEFSYYLILKYSLLFKDFKPLYDFSINFGFYPISLEIIKNNLIEFNSLININIQNNIADNFTKDNITETLEQNKMHNFFIENNSDIISLVAPTSFGKSSLIVESIKKNFNIYNKIAIIVPTKSLLVQTYKQIKEQKFNRKIIIHDSMYENEKQFIAILTQERALRLLSKNLFYDCLFIDEAHKMFEKNFRSIFLSRLIKINKIKNKNHKLIYLSPLVYNSENLKILNDEKINEYRIFFNVKEPEYYEYKLDSTIFKFNRFINDFYKIDIKFKNFFEYIFFTKKEKNFIYINSPKKIEIFAKEMFIAVKDEVNDYEINKIIEILTKYIHKEFYINEYLKKGIIYIHGKLPNNIKEYLEYKFKNNKNINYLIANKVILEGINLPIENIYIFSTQGIYKKDLINLIGRANRLKEVFNNKSNLNKLLPQIYFINTKEFNNKNSNMTNKILLLNNKNNFDIIENPLLLNFDIKKTKKKDWPLFEKIILNEKIIFENDDKNLVFLLKKKMIELGINNIFNLTEELCNNLLERLNEIKENEINYKNVMDKIYHIFIENLYNFIFDKEFARLKNLQAINYYQLFLNYSKNKSLQENIYFLIKYFKKRIEEKDSLFYIGIEFGEIIAHKGKKRVYVDLKNKTEKELINLAIIKLKLEEDFVSHKLNLLFDLLFEYKKISLEEYNKLVFGTNDKNKLSLIKLGLNLTIINKFEKDNQISNIFIDENNNIQYNQKFNDYRNSLDDFIKFELDKIFKFK